MSERHDHDKGAQKDDGKEAKRQRTARASPPPPITSVVGERYERRHEILACGILGLCLGPAERAFTLGLLPSVVNHPIPVNSSKQRNRETLFAKASK